ncbi:hypothetical protein FH972_022959 [Carpinus fangiana]|uniref:Cytochrome P450 n=1 Tax=Carpinus fangiana TaxID=176857 RepID=A0A5N6KU25_9ROSI|nr:hypothetical protein FH972_022959 [Carpinus fangiana]
MSSVGHTFYHLVSAGSHGDESSHTNFFCFQPAKMTASVYILLASVAEAYAITVWQLSEVPTWTIYLGFLVLNFVLYGFYNVFIYPELFSPLKNIPGPPGGRTIGGHAKAKFEAPKGVTLRNWIESIPNDGILRVKEIFRADAVIATSPEILKTVLVDNAYDYTKAHQIKRILRQILGDGLIVVEGDVHKFQRKKLLPSFGVGAIKDLYPLFWDKSTELIQRLSSLPDSRNIAFCEWCNRATLDIIGVAALGKDFDSLGNAELPIVKKYNEVLHPDPAKQIWFLLSFLFPQKLVAKIPFWPLPAIMNRLRIDLSAFAKEIAIERRTEMSSGVSLESRAEKMQLRRADVLSTLVRANELTDVELADQILTMMAAGHETTSSTLSWVAVLLSKNPDIQARLRDEIRANLPSPNDGESISTGDMDKLPLLNAICHETLRLYPTVPFSARTAIKPTPIGGVVLPVGGQVWLPIYAINRSTRFWGADAEDFRPDRWITNDSFNNNGGAKSNYSQLTFLHGPRSCIGQGFAKAELRCLVAALVGRFHLELAEADAKYFPVGMITVKPANDALLNFSVVEGW